MHRIEARDLNASWFITPPYFRGLALSSCDILHQALGTVQLAEAEAERVRLEEHQVVIADVVRGEVCDEWRLVIDRMAEEHEVRCTWPDDSQDK